MSSRETAMSSGESDPMPADIAAYFAAQPAVAQARLRALRQTIKQSAPSADECMRYKMPAFTFHGMLVAYGAFTSHIGFYPGASSIKAFRDELADYTTAKGSVQFPLERAIPSDLVEKIVAFKVNENLEKARAEP